MKQFVTIPDYFCCIWFVKSLGSRRKKHVRFAEPQTSSSDDNGESTADNSEGEHAGADNSTFGQVRKSRFLNLFILFLTPPPSPPAGWGGGVRVKHEMGCSIVCKSVCECFVAD